jgi:hypothetical protein
MSEDGVLDGLARWAADARADEAARDRARERWLRRQAEEEGTLAGALLDLAERRAAVLVATAAGRRHRGTVVAVGADFVGLRGGRAAQVLVPLAAVAWVRPLEGDSAAPGDDRPLALEATLVEALDGLAARRPRTLVVPAAASEALTGELVAVGRDVVTLRLDGDGRPLAFVPVASVTEVSTGDAR